MSNIILDITEIEPTELVSYTNKSVQIGDNVVITSKHDQYCCESVYADFSVLKYAINSVIELGKIWGYSISGVDGEGFVIFFYKKPDDIYDYKKITDGEIQRYGVFIPCYNIQNGFYSDELLLEIKNKNHSLHRNEIIEIDLQGRKLVRSIIE